MLDNLFYFINIIMVKRLSRKQKKHNSTIRRGYRHIRTNSRKKQKSIKNKTKRKTKRKTKLINKHRNMKGGSITDILMKSQNNDSSITEIGRGGFGIAIIDKDHPDSVYKISNKNNTCRAWHKESDIYKVLNNYDIDTNLCKLVKMKDNYFTDDTCAMELTRAYNPFGVNEAYTVQPHFQYETLTYRNKLRGLFLGINELIEHEIFTHENISDYITDLGILMARLHYKIKNDGYDIELFISKKENEQTEIYIGDFDLTQFYEDVPDIERLAWSFEAVAYFPIEGELYDIFSSNYIQEAEKYNMKDVANKVLAKYLD